MSKTNTNELKRTGKPHGVRTGPPALITRHPAWLKSSENYLLLIHWLALNLPRRQILEYCKETGIKVPGTLLGIQLRAISDFAKNRRSDIVMAYDVIRSTALEDAQDRRMQFLEKQYTARDWLYEHMMTDRDNAGRTHMVKDFVSLSNSISELEGFKKGHFNPREHAALKAITDRMFGEGDAAPIVDAEVTVLSSPELPPGQSGSPESAPV